MKGIVLIFVYWFAFNLVNAQNWSLQNSGTSQHLRSVYFVNNDTGYAVGQMGTLLKTANGGTNWFSLNPGTQAHLYAVRFTGSDTGYISGTGGTLKKTTDGGTSWTDLSPGVTTELYSIFFTGPNTGYVVGGMYPSTATILKTTDGGTSWISQIPGTTKYLTSVFFTSIDTGYAVGLNGTILKTINGGTNWILKNSGNGAVFTSVIFTDVNHGYVAGNSGKLMTTSDAGESWVLKNPGTSLDLNSICFVNHDTGYISGGQFMDQGIMLSTINAGAYWEMETLNPPLPYYIYLKSIYFPDSNTGYGVGINGTIMKTTNGGGVGIKHMNTTFDRFIISPNPVKDILTIELSTVQKSVTIQIINKTGQIVFENRVSDSTFHVDLSCLPPSVYILRCFNDLYISSKKIIKE